ncbi:hypothetical protein GCM10009422_29020 [Brevundimonas kwangchunensis]|uniref:Uncharacterized protein n=1 Tax=Brevundimonas kwangchunensis TaxID=322163 RepID=A0ABP3SDQ4_9CAUL
MTPFQTFYLLLSLTVFAFAWLRGGHTERAGVAILVCAYVVSLVAQYIHLNGFRVAEALIDLLVLAGFGWLALRRDRWWTLAATALATLVMVAHTLTFLTPDLTPQHVRADIAARWGIGALVVVCLAGGVLERWMAGEAPVSRMADWKPRRARAT